jgi:isopentenyl phosphate kinase
LSLKPIVLKLGGSVITHKAEPFTANGTAMRRLAAEIAEARIEHLVIIHGGGSFGHPLAKEYAIKEGFIGQTSQLLGFSKTHQSMIRLNSMVLEALIQHNIPALTVAPSSFIVSKAGRIVTPMHNTLRKLLHMGLVPLLYGDAVLDSHLGFTILSGDQLAASIATQLRAERMVLGIDEDGLFTADPKEKKRAELLQNCSLKKLKELQKQFQTKAVNDVTGGMKGKITELIPAVENGIATLIVNASKPRRVYKALRREEVIGTFIHKKEE